MRFTNRSTLKKGFVCLFKILLILDFIFCLSFFLFNFSFLWGVIASLSGGILLGLLLFKSRKKKRILQLSAACLLTVNLGMGFLTLTLYGNFVPGVHYAEVQGGYLDTFFGGRGRTVMVLAPHQDDDLNVAGGIIENYRKQGVTVKMVFTTNGDSGGLGKVRIREAIQSLSLRGVPEEDIIFLGYGDLYRSEYKHLYHAPKGAIVSSEYGATKTYGTESHPDFHSAMFGSPADYTRENYIEDIKAVISKYLPDTIYCIDYDVNPDHRALSLSFEEAMGQMLKKNSSYRPEVFKAFGYLTSWLSPRDFYNLNVKASCTEQMEHNRPFIASVKNYEWNDRFRLPVTPKSLAYTKRASSFFSLLSAYPSQNAISAFTKVVNSDKVYWYRRTDSLLYDASVTASSGNAGYLTDFKLIDSEDITDKSLEPGKNVWAPEAGDTSKQAAFTFPKARKIAKLILYDNPSLNDNVKQAVITLSNGKVIQTGALEPNGSATVVPLDGTEEVTGFTLTLQEWEGERAGLCEIEAFQGDPPKRTFIKLTSEDDNFIYDYTPEDSQNITLKLYIPRYDTAEQPAQDLNDFSITTEGSETITWQVENDRIRIQNPSNQPFKLRITSKENPQLYDEVQIESDSALRKLWIESLQSFERSLDWNRRIYRKGYKIYAACVLNQHLES